MDEVLQQLRTIQESVSATNEICSELVRRIKQVEKNSERMRATWCPHPESGLHVLKDTWIQRDYLDWYCELLIPALVAACDSTRKLALNCRRSQANLTYLHAHNQGPAAENMLENQFEQAVARRWINHGAEGLWARVIKNQVPLKDRRNSPLGVKAIDVLAVDEDTRPVVIELKVVTVGGGADTPLRAVLEAASYACVLQADWEALRAELEIELQNRGLEQNLPDELLRCRLVVGAPPAYWEFWNNRQRTSMVRAVPSFRRLMIAFNACGFDIRFACIDGGGQNWNDADQLVATPITFPAE